jgi:nitrous oxidase accessory protein NosD
MRRVFLILAAFLMAMPIEAGAATIRVPSDEPTIQDGLDAASCGDTVLVAQGTYYEHDIMVKSGVCLRSESGSASSVTIDAQQHDFWAFAIGCMNVDAPTAIEGLTLTGGYFTPGGAMWCRNSSLTVRDVVFADNYSDEGGGLNCFNSSVVLEDVAFMNNWANLAGGGLFASDGSVLTLTGCLFAENAADPERDALGGGIYCSDSSIELSDCQVVVNTGSGLCCFESSVSAMNSTLEQNTGRGVIFEAYEAQSTCALAGCDLVENARGGIEIAGYSGDATLVGCSVIGNASEWRGGGLSAGSHTSVVLSGCTFADNEAPSGGGAAFGFLNASAEISDCTFAGNHATEWGAAIFRDGWGGVVMVNSIVAFNTGPRPLAIAYDSQISCTDIWGNAAGDWVGGFEGHLGVNGNICEDPLFCGDENPAEPFTLHSGSPCASDCNPECGQVGAWGVGCAVTVVKETSWGSIKAMYR